GPPPTPLARAVARRQRVEHAPRHVVARVRVSLARIAEAHDQVHGRLLLLLLGLLRVLATILRVLGVLAAFLRGGRRGALLVLLALGTNDLGLGRRRNRLALGGRC